MQFIDKLALCIINLIKEKSLINWDKSLSNGTQDNHSIIYNGGLRMLKGKHPVIAIIEL